MPNSPFIFGPNGALDLQTGGIQLQNGHFLNSDGAKNYLINPALETGVLSPGWSVFTTTLTGVIPTGTITSSASSIVASVSASGAIQGAYSLNITAASAWTSGQGIISDTFTIDSEDQAKVMTVKFYYNNSTFGTNMNFSGTSSNSLAVYVYDVTNSQWIQPAGVYGINQGVGPGYVTCTFQTASNASQLRLAVLAVNSISAGGLFLLDDFYLGPQTAPLGAVATDYQSYTPTTAGLGTPTSVNFYYSRVGDKLLVRGTLTTGTVTSSTVQIGLPSGLTSQSNINANEMAGVWGRSTIANQSYYVLAQPSVSYVNIAIESNTTGLTAQTPIIGTSVSSSEILSFNFAVPIAGWSSNVQTSNSTDTRVVAAKYSVLSATTPAANTPIGAATQIYDTHAAYSSTTGFYTCPVSGYYKITATLQSSSASTTVYAKNSVSGDTTYLGYVGGTGIVLSGSATFKCNAGDTIGVYSTASIAYNSITVLEFERLSGPSAIAATESVNARYVTNSSPSIGTSSSSFPYATKVYDTHNAYNTSTGTYTIPVSGKYQVKASLLTGSVTLNTSGQYVDIGIYYNGSLYQRRRTQGNGGNNNYQGQIVSAISCNAGDTVQIQALSSVSTAGVADSSFNEFSIERVGN